MNLNLNNPTKSEIKYETSTFPDGQPHFKLLTDTGLSGVHVKIFISLTNMDKFLLLSMATDVLLNLGATMEVFVGYMLGGRMDRAIDDAQPETLACTSRLLDAALVEGTKVTFIDPHSGFTLTELEEAQENQTTEPLDVRLALPLRLLEWCVGSDDTIVVPDEGAVDRVSALVDGLGLTNPVLHCKKVRDSQTGKLSGFAFASSWGEHLAQVATRFLIVDDICDGGGTFTGIAKLLNSVRDTDDKAPVELCVTHGLFTKGLPIEGISKVYTTDTVERDDTFGILTCAEQFGYLEVMHDFIEHSADELDGND